MPAGGHVVDRRERCVARTLSRPEARAFYDAFGAKQDRQAFYEDPAIADLIAHADFEHARAVLEFGCGTGRLAERLLADHLPPDARYRGADISATMVDLAGQRLAPWRDRAAVRLISGSTDLDAVDGSADRFLSTYVLDLLSTQDIRDLLDEARRVLKAEGLLCLVNLTPGETFPSRLVTACWRAVYRIDLKRVGGCRPIRLAAFLADEDWRILHRRVVSPVGISSEIVVASPRAAPRTRT